MTTARLPGIPTAEEEEVANWKLDTEASFAQLVITPIIAISDEDTRYYVQIEETLEIRPYPNPYGFGGMWGHGWHDSEKEAEMVQQFNDYLEKWKALGLHKIDIIRNREETCRVPTEKQRQEALDRYASSPNKELPKKNIEQMRLIS